MMNDQDSAHIRDLLISIASGIERQVTDAIERSHSYAAIYKIAPFPDGDQWCVLLGENLQDGIAGFGPTPHAAIMDFDRQMFNAKAATAQSAVKESLTTAATVQPAEAKVAYDVVRDAERYKLLRSFSWNAADLCVVTNPRFNVKRGSDCPSGARLDEKLDAMLAAKAKEGAA